MGRSLAYPSGRKIFLRSLDHWDAPPRLLAEHPRDVVWLAFSPDGKRLAATDGSGRARIWATAPPAPASRPSSIVRTADVTRVVLDPTGRWLAGPSRRGSQNLWQVWDLTAPWGVQPIELRRADAPYVNGLEFAPDGRWLATSNASDGTLWSLEGRFPRVLAAHEAFVNDLAFTPDGSALVSAAPDRTLRWWPLAPGGFEESRVLLETGMFFPTLAVDPASQFVVLVTNQGPPLRVSLDGAPPLELPAICPTACLVELEGNLVALAPLMARPEDRDIRVLDLSSGTHRRLTATPGVFDRPGVTYSDYFDLAFLGDLRLFATVLRSGLVEYDLGTGAGRLVSSQPQGQLALDSAGRFGVGVTSYYEFVLAGEPGELVRFSLDGSSSETLRSHGTFVCAVALDSTGAVVATGSVDGTVRIGLVSGNEPHVFFGHEGVVMKLAFSPDGRHVASGGHDGTIRLWPVPDLTKPPPHTLELERFLAGLRARTNLRAVRDAKSATGWKIDRSRFPGWTKLPEW